MLICLNDLFACSGLTQTCKLLTNFSKNSFYLLPEPLRRGYFLTNYCVYALDRFKARPPWILISWQHKSTMIREISKTLWNVQHWNCNQWHQLRCKYCPNRKYYSKQKYHKVQVSVVVYRWTSISEMWLRLPHNIVIPDTDRNHSSRRNNGVFSINCSCWKVSCDDNPFFSQQPYERFFDIYRILVADRVDNDVLAEPIRHTFSNRGNGLSKESPFIYKYFFHSQKPSSILEWIFAKNKTSRKIGNSNCWYTYKKLFPYWKNLK